MGTLSPTSEELMFSVPTTAVAAGALPLVDKTTPVIATKATQHGIVIPIIPPFDKP